MADRELCWKPVTDSEGFTDNCDRWEDHNGPCMQTCGDCYEGKCHGHDEDAEECGCRLHGNSIDARELDEDAHRA